MATTTPTPATPTPTSTPATGSVTTTSDTIATTTQAALPYLEGLALLVPGIGSDLAMALKLAGLVEPYVLEAVEALMDRNGGDLLQAVISVIEHLSPSMPNNATLNGTGATRGTTTSK